MPPNDFDEKDLIQDSSSDFDQADLIADSAPVTATEPVTLDKPEESDPIGDSTRGMMTGALGGAIGVGANEAIGAAADFAQGNSGALTLQQINAIDANRDNYNSKELKPLQEMLDNYKQLGSDVRLGGIKAAKDGQEALKKAPGLPVDEFYKTLGGAANDDKFYSQISPRKNSELLNSKMESIQPLLNEDRQRMLEIDSELNNPSPDERLLINQNVKDAKYDRKIEKLTPKDSPTFKDRLDGANELQSSKNDGRTIQRLDESIARASEADNGAKLKTIQERKEDFLYRQANKQEKTGTVKAVGSEINTAKKDELEFHKILDDEKTAQMKNMKQKQKLQSLLDEKASLQAKTQSTITGATESAQSEYNSLRNTPDKILAVTPELADKQLAPRYANVLKKAMDDVSVSDEVSAPRLYQKVKEIRDDIPDGENKGTVGDFNAKTSKAVRGKVTELSKEADELFKKSAASRPIQAAFEKTDVKYDKDLSSIEDLSDIADADTEAVGRTTFDSPQKLNKALLNPTDINSKATYDYFKESIEGAKALGQLPADANTDDLISQYKASALKNQVGQMRGEINTFDLDSIVQGNKGKMASIGSKIGGTALQELIGQYKGSGAAKLAGKVAKTVLPGVGLFAGYNSAANAANNDEITEDQVPVATALEAIAPPLTSGVESMKSANQAFDSSIAQGDSELMANGKAAVGSVTGFVKPFTDGASSVVPAVDKLLEGGVRAVQNGAEAFGTSQSKEARDRMQKQMESLNSFKTKEDPKKGNDFLNFVAKKPEALKELADQLTGAGQSFSGPLMKAAEGSESQRAAILFGLYQQPAFRSLIGEGSLLNQNIPGVKKKDEDELTAVKVPRPM